MVGWIRCTLGGDVVKRPQVAGCRVTTPNAGDMIQLLGSGPVHGGLAVTKSEYRALQRLYDVIDEPPNEKPPAPPAPKREDFADGYTYDDALRKHELARRAWSEWKDPRDFYQAGADRNLMRHAEADGMRIIAWIARFVPAGDDPLKHVVQAFAALGCDTDPADNEWATCETGEDFNEDAA